MPVPTEAVPKPGPIEAVSQPGPVEAASQPGPVEAVSQPNPLANLCHMRTMVAPPSQKTMPFLPPLNGTSWTWRSVSYWQKSILSSGSSMTSLTMFLCARLTSLLEMPCRIW